MRQPLFYCKNKPKKFKETFDNKPKKVYCKDSKNIELFCY